MTAAQLLASLILTAKRAVAQTEEEIIRLKERHEQQRSHLLELESLSDAFKTEASQ